MCANSGVDVSNVDGGKTAVLLPADADRSAAQIHRELKKRTGLHIPVIIADSFGRPWREGLCEVAIGVAGMKVIHDYRGKRDPYGYKMHATEEAVADELASRCGAGMRQEFAGSGLYNPGLSVWSRQRQRAADGAGEGEGFVPLRGRCAGGKDRGFLRLQRPPDPQKQRLKGRAGALLRMTDVEGRSIAWDDNRLSR